MKKTLSVIVTAAMIVAVFSGSAFAGNGNDNGNGKGNQTKLSDVKGHWGEEAILELEATGILTGYEDGTFKPNKTLTQAELAVILDRIRELTNNDDDDNDDEDLVDLEDDEDLINVPGWAKHAVAKGVKNNYLNLKRFHSQQQCDRLLACVALAEALDLDPVYEIDGVEYDNIFSDRGLFTDYQYGMMVALYQEGYIKGFPDGSFNPYSLLNRAQIASILANVLGDDTEVSDDDNAPTWSDEKITESAITATSVKLEWSGAKDDVKVVGYKVVYKVDDDDDQDETVKYVTGKSVTITGLEPDEDYIFTVQARDAAKNWSKDGPTVNVTTLDEDESTEKPYWDDDSEITATAIRATSVDLKWDAAEDDDDDIVGYKVFYVVDGEDQEKSVTGRTTTIKGLEADEKYTFTVQAKDEEGNWSKDGPSVDVRTLDDDDDTEDPTWGDDAKLTISSSSSGMVTIVWPDADDNVGVVSYKLYLGTKLLRTLDGDRNSVNVTGLEADAEYTFILKAVDEAGNVSDGLTKTYELN